MPTARAYSFVLASIAFYFFANQTQIGWVFVLSAIMLVVVVVGWVWNVGILRGVKATRTLQSASPADITDVQTLGEYFEDDTVNITLGLQGNNAPQVNLVEQCPVADPRGAEYTIAMYIPNLPKNGVNFTYEVALYRRGAYHFPPIQVMSRAPFGFFQRTVRVAVDTPLLVYPLVKPLKHLALLDKQPTAQMSYPKVGVGNEVIGVRDFRSGDSPRHIHWRSVARRGTLISKEFAEETQEGLTLFLDRYAPYDNTVSKHTPFEMGIQCAVSIADYALKKRFALYLSAWSDDFALPQGALTRDNLLQYMARVPAHPQAHLADLLAHTPVQQFVAVVVTWADERIIEPLLALQRRGVNLLVVAIDGQSFPIADGQSISALADRLRSFGISVSVVKHGEAWDNVLDLTPASPV